MDFGHEPKLPLFIRAIVGSWCENSASISASVMDFVVEDMVEPRGYFFSSNRTKRDRISQIGKTTF